MRLTLLRLAASALALGAPLALAAPIQITPAIGSNSFGPSVSDDGRKVAFYSASNPTGGNADNSFEIYVYDRVSGAITQVSNHAGGHLTGGNQVPQLSGDGTRLAYQQVETAGGTATFRSVVVDLATGNRTVVTPPAPAGETNELSRDGRTLAIATGNVGLRLYDVPSATLGAPITGNTFSTAMSRDGSLIAVEEFGRLDLRDRNAGTTRAITPAGSGFNHRPDLSDDGRWLAYTSTYDPLGGNADRNMEVFLLDLLTGTLRQVTHSTGDAFTNLDVSLAADGQRMVFTSMADLVGRNADRNQEIFQYDLIGDRLTQLTETAGGPLFSFDAAISGDGRSVAFVSSADFAGQNPNRIPQIFLMDLAPRDAAVPEPPVLLLAAAALGALTLRRRAVARG
jgi:Tol biopolymer transport system component